MTNPHPTDYQLKRRAWKREHKARMSPEERTREKEQRKQYNERFRKNNPDYMKEYYPRKKEPPSIVTRKEPPSISSQLSYPIKNIDTVLFCFNGEDYFFASCPENILRQFAKSKCELLYNEDAMLLDENYTLDSTARWYLANCLSPIDQE